MACDDEVEARDLIWVAPRCRGKTARDPARPQKGDHILLQETAG